MIGPTTDTDGYWRGLAQQALARFPYDEELDAGHLIYVHPTTPDRLEAQSDHDQRAEMLFHLTYMASFAIPGVAPKTLAIGRQSYGWSPVYESPDLVIMRAHHDNVVTGHAPLGLLDSFPVPRNLFADAAAAVGQAMVEIARSLDLPATDAR